MTVAPVIARELRAQARLAFTYGIRMLGASALMAASLIFALDYGFAPDLGGKMFGYLNCTLFFSIWVMAPIIAADCLSRERREGTLGLLFMTPLKAHDIVLAKGLVHGLRVLTLWLAMLPIMTLPFLEGGVGWREGVMSVLVNFSAICWALAAGLLASSFAKRWLRAQISAGVLGFCFMLTFMILNGSTLQFLLMAAAGGRSRLTFWGRGGPWFLYGMNIKDPMVAGFFAATDIDGWWRQVLGTAGGARQAFFAAQAAMALMSSLLLTLVVRVAAWRLQRVWQEEPGSARRQWIERKLFTPIIWVSFLRRWMHRKLERNPIGWLEQRTWSGRVVIWSWFAVMVSLYSAALDGSFSDRTLDRIQSLMAWLLLGSIAASAAGSFQRERESGVMELLLVSPMTTGQIIGGRVRGLWGQFLLAAALQLGIWVYFGTAIPNAESDYEGIFFFCASFMTLPVIGLYYSLRRKNFVGAWLSTLIVGLAAPFGIRGALSLWLAFTSHFTTSYTFRSYYGGPASGFNMLYSFTDPFIEAGLQLLCSTPFAMFLQLLIAAWIWRRLYYSMKRRDFPFSRAMT